MHPTQPQREDVWTNETDVQDLASAHNYNSFEFTLLAI